MSEEVTSFAIAVITLMALVGAAGLIVYLLLLFKREQNRYCGLITELRIELSDRDIKIAVLEANVENWGLVIENLQAREEILKSRMTEKEWTRLNDDTIVRTHWSDSVKNAWDLDKVGD